MTIVSELELISGLKQIVEGHYTVIKEAYEEIKSELYYFNRELAVYNKFLSMIKKPSDFYKKNVSKFYDNEVSPLLVDAIDDIIDSIDEDDYDDVVDRIDLVSGTPDGLANEKIKIVKDRIEYLNRKKESIGNITVYSNKVNSLKKMLKSLSSNMYYEDETSYNNIIEYVSESDIIEPTKSDLLECLNKKRQEFLKKLETQKLENEARKKAKEQQRLERKNKKDQDCKPNINTKLYVFNEKDFLSDEDLELIKQINLEIYKNLDVLNSISQEIIDFIKEAITYPELNLDVNSILSKYNINNYSNIVILYEIRKIIEEIDRIFNFIKSNNISKENINIYKEEICNLVIKVKELYINYVVEEEITEEQIETKEEKHIIYLKNNSGEILLRSDIKGEPENYRYFIKILDDLKCGRITSSHEKDVRFTNNGKLSDVCKKKEGPARLVYCPHGDCYIVFVGFIKKNSNNNYELNLVKNRYSFYKSTIEQIIKDLSDPVEKAQIVEEQDQLHEELITYLKSNSRSHRKELKRDLT